MKKYALVLIVVISLFSCTSEEQETMEVIDNSTPAITSENKMANKPQKPSPTVESKPVQETTVDVVEEEVKPNEEKPEVLLTSSNVSANLSPHQRLLQTLDQSLKIEYAALDFNQIESDTLIQANNHEFEVKYITSCLNDSLVAQEMYDYGGTNAKSYLISHNYRTNVQITVDGQATGGQTVDKYIFAGELDKEFLDHSIIKHPEFVRFDEASNEAVFQFIVGIPNTDWLILAGVNMDQNGKVRIIDIQTPGL